MGILSSRWPNFSLDFIVRLSSALEILNVCCGIATYLCYTVHTPMKTGHCYLVDQMALRVFSGLISVARCPRANRLNHCSHSSPELAAVLRESSAYRLKVLASVGGSNIFSVALASPAMEHCRGTCYWGTCPSTSNNNFFSAHFESSDRTNFIAADPIWFLSLIHI